jgi:hypothetical protein
VEEALEEVALGGKALVAMVGHQTGTQTQLGGIQARRRRETDYSWKMKMMIKMKSLQSLAIQEKPTKESRS